MKTVFFKLSLFCLAAISMLSITACASPAPVSMTPTATAAGTPSLTSSSSAIPVTTGFGQLLGMVPYSFLQKHDAWFGDQEKAKGLYGLEDINNLGAYNNLTADEKKKLKALDGVAGLHQNGNWQQISPLLTGFDVWMVNRNLFESNTIPPQSFYILEGNFSKDLIISDFTALGYQKVDYNSFTYLSINEDYSPGQTLNPITSQVLSAMNRVAVLDNTIVTAPATDLMTGILDAMAKKQPAVIDNPACQAVATSLGDVLSGVIIAPDRVINPGLSNLNGVPLFNLIIPQDWGTLHQYDMVGMGYKDNGQDRYWVISLYYKDPGAASADAGVLVTRMKSYIFNTQFEPAAAGQNTKRTLLTDRYEVGNPTVQKYPGGATLTVECRFKPETPGYVWLTPVQMPYGLRDILFLAPDPSQYAVSGQITDNSNVP